MVRTTDPALAAILSRALLGQPCAGVIVTDSLVGLASLRAAHPGAAVVMVALRRSQIAAALDAGADCALAGPIRPAELRARVRRLASRAERHLRVGPLLLDAAARTVRLDGAPLALPAREFDALRCLASEPGRVFTKLELQRACWSATAPPAPSRTLERHVARLRGRLGPHRSMLVTVWAVGYRLDAPA